MLVTLLGMVMLVRLRQPSNAPSPILVTPSGIVMLIKLLKVFVITHKMVLMKMIVMVI